MAKPVRNLGVAINGVSNKAAENALAATAHLKEGAMISLPVGDEFHPFELVVIPYTEIEKRSSVLPENARLQKALNKISLGKTYESIEKEGQKYPAIGSIDEHGRVEVWDGSCRRKICILTKQDFRILVTRANVPAKAKKSMSDLGNTRNALSLYERGAEWEDMLISGTYPDAKQLAAGEGVDEAIVTAARKAYSIPKELVETIPSIVALGRPSINKITSAIKSLDPKTLNDVINTLKNIGLDRFIEEAESENGQKLNALWLQKFLAECPKPEPKQSKNKSQKKESDIDDQMIIETLAIPKTFKRIPIASRGKTAVIMAEEGKTAMIELANVPNDIMEDIYHFIRTKIEGATND